SNPGRTANQKCVLLQKRRGQSRSAEEGRLLRRCQDLNGSRRRHARRQKDVGRIKWNQAKVVRTNAGETGLMPARDFVGKVIVSFVFLDGPAECRSRLHPRVSRVGNVAEWVHGLKIS